MYLTFRQMLYFVRIVEEGSMTRAGEVLHLVPTALSLQIKGLEDRLGVKLLHRHSRGVRPTDEGVTFYTRSCEILAMVEETEHLISARSDLPLVVQLGILPSIIRMLGTDLMLLAAELLPDIDLRLSEASTRNQIDRLRSRELQFALVRSLPAEDSLQQIDIIEERLVFVTAPEAARLDRTVTLSDALSGNLAFYREGDGIWQAVHAAALAAGRTVRVTQLIGSSFVLRDMVIKGRNTAILPFGIVAKDALAHLLVIHEITDQPVLQRISLAWLTDEEPRLPTRDIVQFVQEIASELDRRTGSLMRSSRNVRPSVWNSGGTDFKVVAETD